MNVAIGGHLIEGGTFLQVGSHLDVQVVIRKPPSFQVYM